MKCSAQLAIDLVFPHHENEIAQSRCADPDSGFAHTWVHNGYLIVDGEKMSKSKGNFHTVESLLGRFPGEALRLALMMAHYRQPLNFTFDGVDAAVRLLDRVYGALREVPDSPTLAGDPGAVLEALEDDLNTPRAVRSWLEEAGRLNKAIANGDDSAISRSKADLTAGGQALGLGHGDGEIWFHQSPGMDEAEIEAAIQARIAARETKDFAEADRIRDDLQQRGIILEDRAGGTAWRREV